MGDAVTLHEPVPRGAISDLLRSADVVVNTHGGGLDKVVYESAACCRCRCWPFTPASTSSSVDCRSSFCSRARTRTTLPE